MADILEFKPRDEQENPNDRGDVAMKHTVAWRCACGGWTYWLLATGEVQCSICGWVPDAIRNWTPDGPVS